MEGVSSPAYRYQHQLARERALRALIDGTPCEICGLPMFRSMGRQLHLDHVVPVYQGGGSGPRRLVHAWCNMSRGGKVGNRITRRLIAARRAQASPPRYDRW